MKVEKRALISVSDKTGLVEFARALVEMEFKIVSTGGTRRFLIEAGIPATDVSEVTGYREMMDGRLKTIHPKIHGGLLGRLDREQDQKDMWEHGIQPFGLVCVNLYPFAQTVAKEGVTAEEATENIDIGGPGMIRSAGKNYRYIYAVTNPTQYADVLAALRASDEIDLSLAAKLSCEVFRLTSEYDAAVYAYKQKIGT